MEIENIRGSYLHYISYRNDDLPTCGSDDACEMVNNLLNRSENKEIKLQLKSRQSFDEGDILDDILSSTEEEIKKDIKEIYSILNRIQKKLKLM
jgi:3-dehydroquinate dehydratase